MPKLDTNSRCCDRQAQYQQQVRRCTRQYDQRVVNRQARHDEQVLDRQSPT